MVSKIPKINVIFFILFLAFILRLPGLDKSFQGDEFFSLLDARNFHEIPCVLIGDTHPPLYFYLLNIWMKISQNEAFLRLLSIIPGIGLCWLTYSIGKKTFGRETGIVASLIVALAPAAVWSSQYIRTYAMASFFTAFSVYFLIQIMTNNKGRVGPWLGFVLASSAGIYTFYFSAVILVAENIFVLLFMRRDKQFIKNWIMAQCAIVILYFPWLPFFIYQSLSYIGHPQELERIGFYVGTLHVGAIIKGALGMVGLDPRFMARFPLSQNVLLKYASMAALAVVFMITAVFTIKLLGLLRPSKKENRFTYLFFILSIGSFAIALVLNKVFKIILMSNYFIMSFVFLVLLILGLFEKAGGRGWKIAFLIILISLYLLRLSSLYRDREMDFKSAYHYVKDIVTTTNAAIVAPSFGGIFDYYFFDLPNRYYLEGHEILRLSDDKIIFISSLNKLELKGRNRLFRKLMALKKYKLLGSENFNDLVVERYSRL